KALAEQTAWTFQAVDLLLEDTARWYRTDSPGMAPERVDEVLASRAAGVRQRYALAMEGANEGHWDWDLATDQLFLSPKMKTLEGQSADVPTTTRTAWRARTAIHAADAL